jgi:hypothetical protein
MMIEVTATAATEIRMMDQSTRYQEYRISLKSVFCMLQMHKTDFDTPMTVFCFF